MGRKWEGIGDGRGDWSTALCGVDKVTTLSMLFTHRER